MTQVENEGEESKLLRTYSDEGIQVDKKILVEAAYPIEKNLAKFDRAHMLSQLKSLKAKDKQFKMIVDGKRKEMEPLQHAMGKLHNSNTANRERGGTLCSYEEELNKHIQILHYHMKHESIPLV